MVDTVSMQPAEHETEGQNEARIALTVADMQNPVTPILKAALVGEGLHDAGRMIAHLNQIVDHGAAVIEENLLRVGAEERTREKPGFPAHSRDS
jgi:hypothetical protein